jgi:hypothetical protein
MVLYCPHLRLGGELEDGTQENRLSAPPASYNNAERSTAYNCTSIHRQVGLDVLYIAILQTAMIRHGRGVKEAATHADIMKVFPATACSMWQDPLYAERGLPDDRKELLLSDHRGHC